MRQDAQLVFMPLPLCNVDIDTDVPFQESDPIRTGSGVPIHNAVVVIKTIDGDSAIGVEEVLVTGPTGVYRFTNDVITSSTSRFRASTSSPANSAA